MYLSTFGHFLAHHNNSCPLLLLFASIIHSVQNVMSVDALDSSSFDEFALLGYIYFLVGIKLLIQPFNLNQLCITVYVKGLEQCMVKHNIFG